uniref:RH1 domain-containing protein n=1 Tax=Macrostomum lignano TaxID=282301 RepID=A0A1I8IZA8_9PLAT
MESRSQPSTCTSNTANSGSTLYSIPEQDLQACPETPEHLAVCLIGVISQRLHQLGFQLPDSLRLGQQKACKVAMLTSGDDVLQLFKQLLDDYERLRAERDDMRAAESLQRHEIGRLSRQAASLQQQLLAKDKKLADVEYRLEEAGKSAENLRAEARREVQKARLAASEGRRLAETAQHRERRTELELWEARQRLERNGQPALWRSGRLRHRGGGSRGGGGGFPSSASTRKKAPPPAASHAVP